MKNNNLKTKSAKNGESAKEGILTVSLNRIFKSNSSLLLGRKLRKGCAILSKHAKKRMTERGICQSAMKAAVEFGTKGKTRGATSFWLNPRAISKWKMKGIDLSWASGVQVLIRGVVCITTYLKLEEHDRTDARQAFKKQKGKPFSWARVKNRIFNLESENYV